MAGGKRSSEGEGGTSGAPGGRKRRTPTIELTATEIPTDPSKSSRDSTDADAVETPAPESAPAETMATPPQTGHSDPSSAARGPSAAGAAPSSDSASAETDPAAAKAESEETASSPEAGPSLPNDDGGAEPDGDGIARPPQQRQILTPLLAAAAGAVLAMLVGAALWLTGVLGGPGGDGSALQARVAQLEQQIETLRKGAGPPQSAPSGEADAGTAKTIAVLQDRVAALESAKPPAESAASAANVAKVQSDLGQVTAQVRRVNDSLANLGDRVAANSKAIDALRNQDAAAATALADVKQSVQQLQSSQVGRDTVQQLAQRTRALEQATQALKDEQARRAAGGIPDRAARRLVVAEALRSAVLRGVPFSDELTVARALAETAQQSDLQALAPFAESGVPSSEALAQALTALLPSLSKAGVPPPAEGDFLSRLQANAERLVRVRPAGRDTPENSAAGTVARVAARAARDDIDGALTAVADLPPEQRRVASDWMARAQARQTAIAASRDFLNAAVAALSRDVTGTAPTDKP